MKTVEGYSKEKYTDDSVLLAGGGAKALSNFIGALSWDSTNKKITYTPVGGSATDLVSLSWDNISSKPDTFPASAHDHDTRYELKATYNSIYGGNGSVHYWKIAGAWTSASYTSHNVFIFSTRSGESYYVSCGTDDGSTYAPYIVKMTAGYGKISGWKYSGRDLYIKTELYDNRIIIKQIGGVVNALTITEITETDYNAITSVGTVHTNIDSGNISSQSVSYADSAGGVSWDNVSGKPSTFPATSHNHNDLYVTSLGVSGDYLTWAKNGSTNNITVPFATNADTLDDYHLSSIVAKSGENLIKGTSSASSSGWTSRGWSGGQVSTEDESQGIYNFKAYSGWSTLSYSLPSYCAGKIVSYSFDVKIDSSRTTQSSGYIYVNKDDWTSAVQDITSKVNSSDYTHIYGSYTATSSPTFGIRIGAGDESGKTLWLLVKNLKVELGDLPSIWTPARADINEFIRVHAYNPANANSADGTSAGIWMLHSGYGATSNKAADYSLFADFSTNAAHLQFDATSNNDIYARSYFWTGSSGFTYPSWVKLLHSANYTDYVNTTNFPGLNSTGTVTSVTLKAGTGISLDTDNTAITTSGTRTITNAGVRAISIDGNYLKVNTNGTEASLTIPYASSTGSLSGYGASDFRAVIKDYKYYDVALADTNNWFLIGTINNCAYFNNLDIYVTGINGSMNNTIHIVYCNCAGWSFNKYIYYGSYTNTNSLIKVGFYVNAANAIKVFIYLKNTYSSPTYPYTGYRIHLYYNSSSFTHQTPAVSAESAITSGQIYEVGPGNTIVANITGNAGYASSAGNASTLGGYSSSDFLRSHQDISGKVDKASTNRPGITRLYRRDDDSNYSVQTDWTGTYWRLRGYSGDTYHAGCQVAYADSTDSLGGYALADFSKIGLNLIAGTSFASTSGWNQSGWGGGISTHDADTGVYNMWSSNGWRSLYYTLASEYASKKVAYSFEVMRVSASSTEAATCYIGSTNSLAGSNAFTPQADTWTRITGTLTLGSTPYFTISIRGSDSAGKVCYLRVRSLKVELGNLQSIWTPAPKDFSSVPYAASAGYADSAGSASSATNATYASYVKDIGNSTAISLKYSSGGFTSNPSYLAAWNSYQITYVAPSYVTVGKSDAVKTAAYSPSSNVVVYPTFVDSSNSTAAYESVYTYGNFTYYPYVDNFNVNTIRGTWVGNFGKVLAYYNKSITGTVSTYANTSYLSCADGFSGYIQKTGTGSYTVSLTNNSNNKQSGNYQTVQCIVTPVYTSTSYEMAMINFATYSTSVSKGNSCTWTFYTKRLHCQGSWQTSDFVQLINDIGFTLIIFGYGTGWGVKRDDG